MLEKKFSYELRNIETGKYIANMEQRISRYSDKQPFNIGDEIPIPDAILYTNNSLRLRSCIVNRLEHIRGTNKFTLYLRITKNEVMPLGFVDLEKSTNFLI